MKAIDDLPKGIIPRIENKQLHLDFVRGNKDIKWVMIDIHIIEQFIKKNITSSFFEPNIKIISTTTVNDNILVKYFFEKELEVIKQFQPDFHIPCDFPLYLSQPERERIWFLKNYLNDLEKLFYIAKDLNINLIPLIKGINFNERNMCYQLFNKLNINYPSYYATQYFKKGSRKKELEIDIRSIISESGYEHIMIIGIQSLPILGRLPPQVIAVAGLKQWRIKSNLGNTSIKEARENYVIWKKMAENKLSCGQNVLGNYI